MRKIFKDIFNPIRIILIVFFTLLLLFIAGFIYFLFGSVDTSSEVDFGVTFSQISAEEMKLDWKKTYAAILNELNIKKFRLIAYWSIIEPNKDEYSFSDLDWQIREIKRKGGEVILAVGSKLPGLLECYIPEWAKDLNNEEKQERTLLFLNKVAEHYKSEAVIKTWQIEDNPFERTSEECIKFDKEFLNKEISSVRESDFSNRPIMLTTDGELSIWLRPALLVDNLGISIYRNNWTSFWGQINYPIKPIFYKKRADFNKFLTKLDNIIVTELQAEPKGSRSIINMSSIEWDKSMSLDKFIETIDYVNKTGFDEVYLKGVEWWYYMKKQGDDSFWREAQKFWSK